MSSGAQVGIAVLVVTLYSAALAGVIIAVTGGGSDAPAKPAVHKATALELRIRNALVKAGTVQFEEGDVTQFRTPSSTRIRCKGSACNISYLIAVPGAGRILEQQAFMVRAVLGKLPVTRLQIDVVRGLPTGPAASAAKEEETNPGLPLLRTTCSWQPGTNASTDPFVLMSKACTSQRPGNTGAYQAATGGGHVHLPPNAPEYQPGNPRYPTGPNGVTGN